MNTDHAALSSPRAETAAASDETSSAVRSARRQEWAWGLSSVVLIWMAFPPLHLWALAWVAPFGWLRLIRKPQWQTTRPYRWVYLIGLMHWLLMIQWVRLPHWLAYFGWIALAGYLAVFLPLFVAITRVMVHRWGLSSVVAAPVVWTGLELVRSRLFTGFAIALLGHSQESVLPIVQIADTVGAYGVSFLVMLVAACVERLIPLSRGRRVLWPLLPAIVSLGACWLYGTIQLRPMPVADTSLRHLRVALIQGTLDTKFDGDVESRSRQAFLDYVRLSRQAAAEYQDLDLMVWPESMFSETAWMISYEPPLQMIPRWEGTLPELQKWFEQYGDAVRARFAWVAQQVHTPLLVGIAWDHYVDGHAERYNSAVMTDRRGKIVGRYDKMHPVMFGEYVPLGNWFPWLYDLTPMPEGLTAGQTPKSFLVGDVRVVPNICFENTVPHLMRRQIRQLERQDESPDVLITITNDGWFWGSSLLDLHLACGVFRAIELRKPLLIAANTGFSAWIDARGEVRAKGPRRAEGTLLADVVIQPRSSRYLAAGDWFAGLCLLITVGAACTSAYCGWKPCHDANS